MIVTRYAPSPTGSPHIGNIRTALFSWLYARHHGGKFILRIEDTDQKREKENGLPDILESLKWLGIDWDEGPIKQSDRLELYQISAEVLDARGYAYKCFCTKEELASNGGHGYNRKCRDMDDAESTQRWLNNEPCVYRLKVPLEGITTYHDVIHGDISFNNKDIDDQVLLKADGFPTYHLAVVVDDHYMKVTHVIRGDDWISSGPKHALLYKFFGWAMPVIAQLPMVLGPDKSKLSKRHGDTSVLEFKHKGYLPEAMLNFLARLGWSLDDKTELFTREDLIKNFDLNKVGTSAAVVDVDKLKWFNKHYIKRLSDDELAGRLSKFGNVDARLVPLMKDRLTTLTDAEQYTIKPHICSDELLANVNFIILRGRLFDLDVFDAKHIENAIRACCTQLNVKLKDFAPIITEAITGSKISLPLFALMEIMGKSEVMKRLRYA